MNDRISKNDLAVVVELLCKKYGYRKYITQGRYGYTGVDECNKEGGILRTYRTGLTKREAYLCLTDLLNG